MRLLPMPPQPPAPPTKVRCGRPYVNFRSHGQVVRRTKPLQARSLLARRGLGMRDVNVIDKTRDITQVNLPLVITISVAVLLTAETFIADIHVVYHSGDIRQVTTTVGITIHVARETSGVQPATSTTTASREQQVDRAI